MVTEQLLQLVRKHMMGVKVPGHHEKVYKEECMFTFDTPESPGGIYVNLQTFQGFGEDHAALDAEKSGNHLYLHEKWHRVPLTGEEAAAAEAKPDKLAIGGEGGFQVDKPKFKIEKEHSLVIFPERLSIPLPCPELPEIVLNSINAVIAHESASLQEQVAVWEEERRVSKYAENLEQWENTGRKISPNPKDWKCEETGVTENLWLNLSTGFIGSGRQNWDGSGGNGAALRHFEATGGKYPLVVKLGTITPTGADVFSYAPDEGDMVLDPWLDRHLAHWGINMMIMNKTEKTMAELMIDLNINWESSRIMGAGAAAQPLYGPGYIGLVNMGNTCYMNSVLQALWSIPELSSRYVEPAENIFRSSPADPATDLPSQLAKVGVAMVQGRTGRPMPQEDGMEVDGIKPRPEECNSVRPQGFKWLVGRGHAEFSSNRQQDAVEFFQHLVDLVSRAEHGNTERLALALQPPTSALFAFKVEDRIQCNETSYVSYKQSESNVLSLSIPMEAATNKEEVAEYQEREAKRQRLKEAHADAYITADGGSGDVAMTTAISRDSSEEPVLPRVPFAACLEQWASPETMADYQSAVLGGKKTTATRYQRFASLPPYLMLALKRYYVGSDWTPKKLEVAVDMPDNIKLDALRSKGPQPGEMLQPDEPAAPAAGAAPTAAARPAPDPDIVHQLVQMGFSENGSRRAAVATSNSGAEAAMEWVLGHMEDPDFNDPLPDPSADAAPPVNPEHIASLTAMGFTERQAEAALKACSNSIERAADWLFSHMDDLDAAVAKVLDSKSAAAGAESTAGSSAASGSRVLDGPGDYELVGIISHMGSNTACGHYVAHIKKGGRWVMFNDEKVHETEKPPKELGYMYLYKRVA